MIKVVALGVCCAVGCSAKVGSPQNSTTAGSTAGDSSGGAGSATSSSGGSSRGAATGGSSSGSSATACKRGLAYGYDSHADQVALSAGIGWWYNWATAPDAGVASTYAALGLEYVPMVGHGNFNVATVESQIPAGAKYLLGFNEPNFISQGNLTPAAAAAKWPDIEAIANAKGLKIVSPAVNYCGPDASCVSVTKGSATFYYTSPFDWMDDFLAACTNCQIDYIALHWYACDDGSSLASTVKKFEAAKYGGRPIWVTEMACLTSNSVSAQQKYMTGGLPALENDANVFRYAWFTGRSTDNTSLSLLGADGTLTTLGDQYVSTAGACSP